MTELYDGEASATSKSGAVGQARNRWRATKRVPSSCSSCASCRHGSRSGPVRPPLLSLANSFQPCASCTPPAQIWVWAASSDKVHHC
eukprot:5429403-Lingulodinium_polyedra.AAC.1